MWGILRAIANRARLGLQKSRPIDYQSAAGYQPAPHWPAEPKYMRCWARVPAPEEALSRVKPHDKRLRFALLRANPLRQCLGRFFGDLAARQNPPHRGIALTQHGLRRAVGRQHIFLGAVGISLLAECP